MIKEKEIRAKIIKQVEKISTDKLDDIWKFLRKIEENSRKKSDILSFAGCWKDLDRKLLDDLTINLGANRLKENRGRI